ncbi:MAG: hypothetical protein ACI4U3_03795, partial [Traorella sp.]
KSNQRIKEYQQRNKPKKVKRKIDFSLISFILILLVIFGCVVFVGSKYIAEYLNKDNHVVDEKPKQDENQESPDIDKDDDPVIIEKEIEVIQGENVNTFIIQNAKDKFVIKIDFIPNSWFQLKLDGVVQSTPKATIYNAGDSLEIEIDPLKNQEITMRFGYFAKMKLYVDGKEVVFDASIANSPGVQDITFVIGGESDENESAQ